MQPIGRLLAPLVVLFVLLCLACGGAVRPVPRDIVEVDLGELLAKWKQNPVSVLEKYQGKEAEVAGHVKAIDTNGQGQTYIKLAPHAGARFVEDDMIVFLLDSRHLNAMKDYPIGAKVRIQARLEQFPGHQLSAVATGVLAP